MSNRPYVGIDLGMTYTRVSVFINGTVKILADAEDNRHIPSYVAFTDTVRLVGSSAKNKVTLNPSQTVFGMK